MFGFHGWLHLMTTAALAMVFKEYMNLKAIIHEEHRVKLWHSVSSNGIQRTKLTWVTYPLPEPPTSRPMGDELPVPQFIADHIPTPQPSRPQDVNMVGNRIQSEGTSVWCHGNQHTNRICRFRNICYLPAYDDFVFFHHNKSIIHGLPLNRFDPALLDWSSVSDHSLFYFNFIDMPVEKATQLLSGAKFIKDVSLVYKRFLSDNIMHVLHDDLLPMFYTLQLITGQNFLFTPSAAFDVQVTLMDSYKPGVYAELYNLFTYKPAIFKQAIMKENKPLCFGDAYFGISKHTVWYDYGFSEPQHPIGGLNITGTYVREFTNFVANKLSIQKATKEDLDVPLIVVFSRKYTRKILNGDDLKMSLIHNLNARVVRVYSEDMTAKEIIELVSQASVAIGMHGVLMTYIMFLPPGALVIELFPYAINPNNYTPYKTVCELPGMGIMYKTWQNMDISKSVTHPQRSKEEGGIRHLTLEEQRKIESSTEVPKHLCCSNPEFLYRIDQDTNVDVNAIVTMVRHYLDQSTDMSLTTDEDISREVLFPGEIRNGTCIKNPGDNSLVVTWLPPWNIPYLKYTNLHYEVLVQEQDSAKYESQMVKMTTLILNNMDLNKNYLIWVKCLLDREIVGPLNSLEIRCL